MLQENEETEEHTAWDFVVQKMFSVFQRTHLRGPRIEKFYGGGMPPDPLGGAHLCTLLLTPHLHATLAPTVIVS